MQATKRQGTYASRRETVMGACSWAPGIAVTVVGDTSMEMGVVAAPDEWFGLSPRGLTNTQNTF